MTLDELPIGKEAVITKVSGEGCAALPVLGYGTDPEDKSSGTESGTDGRSDRTAYPWI